LNSSLDRIIALANSGAIVEGNLEFFLDLTLETVCSRLTGVVSASVWIRSNEVKSQFKCMHYRGDESCGKSVVYGELGEAQFQSAIIKNNNVYGYVNYEFEDGLAKDLADKPFLQLINDQLIKVYRSDSYLKTNFFKGIDYAQLIAKSPDAIMVVSDGILVECNQATVTMFNAHSKRFLFGMNLDNLSAEYQSNGLRSSELASKYAESALSDKNEVFSWEYQRIGGNIFSSQVSWSSMTIESNKFIFSIVRDFSGGDRVHQKLFDRATFCKVTGFYNQAALIEKAEKLDEYHLILVNIESLSDVSHVLGIPAEKDYLRRLANRIKKRFSRDDILVGRGRESEICFIVSGNQMSEVTDLVAQIELCMDEPVILSGVNIPSDNYFGIVCSESLGEGDLHWQSARAAMNMAKEERHKIVWFDEKLKKAGVVRSLLITDLKDAIEQDQLYLLYQPKLALISNKVTSVEALVRWNHPEKGIIPPDLFIPLAEKTEFIHDITRWVISSCCKQAARWKLKGLDIVISLNLSSRDLSDERLIDYIKACLKEHDLSSKCLQLEITESAALQDEKQSIETIIALKELGSEVAIDDYGTGYSSLSHLRTFPFDVLKIDRSFITDLVDSKMNRAVVKSTICMCHEMGFSVVAEGIEDQGALELLAQWGCDVGQGYFISRPITAADVEVFSFANEIDKE
jgi:EAL domain-containing protein (putative c-di-GMP-specific phosphodiesterase class I)/GGDEF domain-containing protein